MESGISFLLSQSILGSILITNICTNSSLLDSNLYIGTSAGEILHYVQTPLHPADPSSEDIFILAVRLNPPVNEQGATGIQQILLLPNANKACILSNSSLSFYTLPELSPAFPQLEPWRCGWVGGIDLEADESGQYEAVIMVGLRNRITLVKVAEQPMRVRDIEFRSCLSAARRGNFACVADARTYTLLDVGRQQKIPLFSISSVDDQSIENTGTTASSDEPRLRPLIESPNSNVFLLVMGTTPPEPGVGVLVDLDGEITCGTIEFASYPDSIVVDGQDLDVASTQIADGMPKEVCVLATVRRQVGESPTKDVQIQHFDIDTGEGSPKKEWLGISSQTHGVTDVLGLRQIVASVKVSLPEITDRLAMSPIQFLSSSTTESNNLSIIKRQREEREFINNLCKIDARITVWVGDEVFWILRNPMILRLDAHLRLAQSTSMDTNAIRTLINDIRGINPQTEFDFFTLTYIRQKAAILLFMDLILCTASGMLATTHDINATERALAESEVDPRVILAFLPLRDEIVCSQNGVWVQAGLKGLLDQLLAQNDISKMPTDPDGCYDHNILRLVYRILLFWRQKRGHPSITDSSYIFRTVDSTLLHILLLCDSNTACGPAAAGSMRAELNSLVDAGVEDVDRAIVLLEQFERLYTLSRLYLSQKQPAKVLQTWQRIICGEGDSRREFIDGEQQFRIYLSKLRNRQLVEEYGTWLAKRNPALGVQVFVDDNSRTKFLQADTLELLRNRAPGAIRKYLEHLVFRKKQPQHTNELISFYLDTVLAELGSSESSQATIISTYKSYRALRPPKSTYLQFIANTATSSDEWQTCRNSLLQLLDATQDAVYSYDVTTVLQRIMPFKSHLIPEMIILYGRQGRHEEAIRLLTHSLGDFEMAASYCLSCGRSIFGETVDEIDFRVLPAAKEQGKLLNMLLEEFLRIEDISDRIELTSELLERFGRRFDILHVLSLLPSSWLIGNYSSFFISALRRHVRHRNETSIVKALSDAEHIIVNVNFIEMVEARGPIME